ncbi:MAG: 5-oxoprolinase subunit PxpB [Chitinophagaceae bacterium]
MNYEPTYRIFPLGDAAITIDFGSIIDEQINKKILAGFHQLQKDPLPAMIEAVPAYSSLTVYYDLAVLKKIIPGEKILYDWMKEQLEKRDPASWDENNQPARIVKVPVCYENEFAPDIAQLASYNNIGVEEVIALHVSASYRVYMLGFLPGFAYMGPVKEHIQMPRKLRPAKVAAGSVGIAGNQTGIYPLASPGGWHIIGRTPLRLFDAGKQDPTLLKAGDTVQFYSIATHEFENY